MMVSCVYSQTPEPSTLDSTHHVGEVVVVARLTQREVIPSHVMKGEQLERLNSHSIADA